MLCIYPVNVMIYPTIIVLILNKARHKVNHSSHLDQRRVQQCLLATEAPSHWATSDALLHNELSPIS